MITSFSSIAVAAIEARTAIRALRTMASDNAPASDAARESLIRIDAYLELAEVDIGMAIVRANTCARVFGRMADRAAIAEAENNQ